MNNRNHTSYLEIRALLDRWYAGETTPREERCLAGLLASAAPLPPDIADDAALFAALRAAAVEESVMPGRLAERMEEALEKEMNPMEGASAKAAAAGKFHRRLIAAASIAAAVCLLITAAIFISRPDPQSETAKLAEAGTQNLTMEISDTVIVPAPRPAIAAAAPEAPARHSKAARKSAVKTAADADSNAGYDKDTVSSPSDDFLDPGERERLTAANIRIVENEAEAELIISSVFSRMESRISREEMEISSLNADYLARTADLCQ